MEAYMNPMVLIPILTAMAGGIFYYIYTLVNKKYSRKRVKGGPGGIKEEINELIKEIEYEPVYAYIHNISTLREYFDFIPGEDVKKIIENYETLGQQLTFDDNKKGYEVVKATDGNYVPVIPPPPGENDDPSQLYYESEHPDIKLMMRSMFANKSLLAKYGQVLWWIAVMGFLMLMWTQS